MSDDWMHAFTPLGWIAMYDGEPERAVEAWSPFGDALVVDKAAGKLVPAHEVPNFVNLRRTNRVNGIISAAPGWRVDVNESGIGIVNAPIVAWVLDGEGDIRPVPAFDGESFLTPLADLQKCEIRLPAGKSDTHGD